VPHVRTSVRGTKKTGRSPIIALGITISKPFCRKDAWVAYQVKAFEEHRFRPTYAGANVGHPSFQKATLEPEEYDYVACHLFCHIN
jgi:hypothetical protein